MLSTRWIASLFKIEAARMTPLDFRLIAPAMFRLLAIECTTLAATVNNVSAAFLVGQLVGKNLISRQSLEAQAQALVANLRGKMFGAPASTRTGELFIIAVQLGRMFSAVHTNGFILSVPGSNEYQAVDNYYPLHSNASFGNVSDVAHVSQKSFLFEVLHSVR